MRDAADPGIDVTPALAPVGREPELAALPPDQPWPLPRARRTARHAP